MSWVGTFRQAAPLVVRSMHWQPLLGMALAAILVLARSDLPPSEDASVAAACVAIGLSFVLDDPAASTLACSPSTLLQRACMRLALALPAAVTAWLVLLAAWGSGNGLLPTRDDLLLFATLTAVVLAVEATSTRHQTTGGFVAAPALLALALIARVLPEPLTLFPVAGHTSRWWGLLGVSTAIVVLALRDPGRHWWRAGARADPARAALTQS